MNQSAASVVDMPLSFDARRTETPIVFSPAARAFVESLQRLRSRVDADVARIRERQASTPVIRRRRLERRAAIEAAMSRTG